MREDLTDASLLTETLPTLDVTEAAHGRVSNLTVLRGLAALAVVLTHCLRLFESVQIAVPGWLAWFDVGLFAVYVFFGLSGFTLVLAHRRDGWDAVGWRRFVTRRFFRIYPAFLMSFSLCLAMMVWIERSGALPPNSWLASTNRIPSPDVAAAMLTFTSNLFNLNGYVNNAFWSMPIEFQFYLLFPPLMVLLRRSLLLPLTAAVLLFGVNRLFRWPGQTAELVWIFAAGMAGGWLFVGGRAQARKAIAAMLALLAITIACVLSDLPPEQLRVLPGPLSFYLGTLALTVVYAAPLIGLSAGRVGRAMQHLGEISYSVYLFHTPLLLLAFLALQGSGVHGGAALALTYAIVLPGTVALAHVVHRAVEQPGIAVGRFLTRRPQSVTPI